jgi:hypothetical protein
MPRESSPHRKPAQPTWSNDADEGRAVVGLNGRRETVLLEEAPQHFADLLGPHRLEQHDGQDLAAEGVADGERLASVPVLRAPPALEVHRPKVVRRMNLDPRFAIDAPHAHRRPTLAHPAEALEDAGHRALARSFLTMSPTQHAGDLVRPPARVSVP